jgi:hypothetical protein
MNQAGYDPKPPKKIEFARTTNGKQAVLQNVGAISLRNHTFLGQHSSDYANANRSYAG